MLKIFNILRRATLLPVMAMVSVEGAPPAPPAPPTPPTPPTPTPPTPPAPPQPGGKTYSEEEAERIATEREERARRAALRSYFEQQGYTAEEVTELLKADKEKKEAAKTEAQREKEKREAAERQRDQAMADANAKLAKAAFLVQAIAAGIPADRTEDAAALVAAQLAELKPNETTGDFKPEDVKKIAEDLVKAKPWLKGDDSSQGGVGDGKGNPPGGSAKVGDFGRSMAKKTEPNADDPWTKKRNW